MTPVVWVGGLCGVVTDAMPGTRAHDESECETCSDGCVAVAAEASEYDVGDPDEEESEFDLSDAGDIADADWSLSARGALWDAEDEQ